jgi:sugar (pentulose or hexulose) kinase
MTSSATKKDVVIGPQEASTLGNALILMLQANVIGSIEEGKKLIKNFIGSEKYSPLQEDEYDRHYQQFCKIIER